MRGALHGERFQTRSRRDGDESVWGSDANWALAVAPRLIRVQADERRSLRGSMADEKRTPPRSSEIENELF
jgi:hypothetical protein